MKDKIKSILKKALDIGFFHLLSANMFLQIAGFGMQIFLTRILPEADIGRIKILQSFIAIITIIAGLGINTAILKLCSEKIEQDEKVKIFINGVKINIITSTVVMLVVYVIAQMQLFSDDIIINNSMKYYVLQIPFLVLNAVAMVYLQSQKKIQVMSKVQIWIKVELILFSIAMSYIFGFYGYVFGIVVANAIGFVMFLSLFKKEKDSFVRIRIEKKYVKKIINIGKFAFAANAIGQLIASTDVIMLNYLVSDIEQIGFYGIAQLIIMSMRLIPSTYSQIMVPYISEVSEDMLKVDEIFRDYNKKMRLLMTLVCAAAYIIVPYIIPIAFGASYHQSVRYFKVLLLGLYFWSLYSPKGITLMSLGKINLNFYVSVAISVINLIVNYLFIRNMGMIGAAYGTTLSYFVGMFIQGYVFKNAVSGNR